MGSFLELMLDVDVKPDAPDEVLAAFSSARTTRIGPDLPEPYPPDDDWEFDDAAYGDEEGDVRFHDWAAALSEDHSGTAFPGPTRCSLGWNPTTNLWHLSSRAVWKLAPEDAAHVISWMGPYLCPSASRDHLEVVGSILFEHTSSTHWIHHDGRHFLFDGLDDASDW